MTCEDYLLCGWRIRSDLPLPDLAPAPADGDAPDLRFRLGETPDSLAEPVMTTPFATIDRDGRYLLEIRGVARFFVGAPDEVTITPAAGADPAELRLFLLGSVLGVLLHRHGRFPLHASCVEIAGRAFAFAGASGAGKSTTALGLAQRGHRLLADDICVIDDDTTPVRAVPTMLRLKLWQDSLAAADIPRVGLERLGAGREKYAFHPAAVAPGPVALGGIVLLRQALPRETPSLDRLASPLEAVAAIGEHVFRRRAAQALGRDTVLLRTQAVLAGTVPVYRLARPASLVDYESWLDELEAALSDVARVDPPPAAPSGDRR